MKPKFCSCSHSDVELCRGVLGAVPCFCACHKAERRPVAEVEADLRERLAGMGTLSVDRAENPVGPTFFTLKGPRSTHGHEDEAEQEVIIEYEPGEGFGLTLVGWGEDEDRTHKIEDVASKIRYWADGYI